MQPVLFSTITEVKPAIRFTCFVDGKPLRAKVTHTEDDGIEVIYHVSFSDGHKGEYVPGEPGVQPDFGRTRSMDAYEEAVFDDLSVIPGLKNGGRYSNVCIEDVDGDRFNIWFREKNGYYSVYYKGQYQFTLRRKQRWEVSSLRKHCHVINQQIASLMTKHLESIAKHPGE